MRTIANPTASEGHRTTCQPEQLQTMVRRQTMHMRLTAFIVGITLVTASSTSAQVLRGVLTVTGAEMH
jgi:hypothetical protein